MTEMTGSEVGIGNATGIAVGKGLAADDTEVGPAPAASPGILPGKCSSYL